MWQMVDAEEVPPRSFWSALRSSIFGLWMGEQYLPDSHKVLKCSVCGRVRRVQREG